jgi:hypothetical protein
MNPLDEVGRELRVADLHVRMVVVLARPDSEKAVTAWVLRISEGFVFFYMGVTGITFMGKVCADGTVVSGEGLPVSIFEYLGEI